ncbi:MAG: T9SS C-terminal target domain-containing protein [Bacteroidetes bacterium]|nr:MAG: T9SS C-terminal target domain-containing protein [Bacteroidota bacterium]
MGKRIYFTLFSLLVLLSTLKSQTNFYYLSDGSKVFYSEIENLYLVHFKNGLGEDPLEISQYQFVGDYYLLSNTTEIEENYENYTISKCLSNGVDTIYENDELVLAFKNSTNQSQKDSLINAFNLSLIQDSSFFKQYGTENPLEDAAAIFESGLVKFCHPNFIINPKPTHIPNDTYFHKQFYLNNTGQPINNGLTGMADADIDAPEAWNITKGNNNIIVSIVDRGITSNHPDLPNSRQVRLPGANFGGAFPYDPNDLTPTFYHGDACAGILAAEQDNNYGISGVAPVCKIMPVKFEAGVSASSLAQIIDFSANNNSRITSNSWTYGSNIIPVVETAIRTSSVKDVIQVFAVGNTRNGSFPGGNINGVVDFPANTLVEKGVLRVGASDRNNQIALYSPINEQIDIVAPSSKTMRGILPNEGEDIWTIDVPDSAGRNPWPNSSFNFPPNGEVLPSSGINHLALSGRFSGTSAATPMVAGVAALVLSVNNCLGNNQVKDILLNTADKVGGYNYNWSSMKPGHSKELGYGKVNAHQAVLAAQSMQSSTLDLLIKDVPEDFGYEPDTVAQYLYVSEDIWVRNDTDGLTFQYTENPEYSSTDSVYVYVRVRNKSCVDAGVNDSLKLHWAKASTALSWPSHWDGSMTSPVLMGEALDIVSLNGLIAGKDTIIRFPWLLPNPNDYASINQDIWHFCLLARILSTTDPMSVQEGSVLWQNVKNNNNIAWKNVTLVDKHQDVIAEPEYGLGASIAIGNDEDEGSKTIKLDFFESTIEFGNPLFDAAEITIKLDEKATQKWENGGEESNGLEYHGDGVFKVTDEEVNLSNLNFEAGEQAYLYLGVNFLTEEVEEKIVYKYHVEQSEDVEFGEFIGGEQFLIHRDNRNLFTADAGDDEQLQMGESVHLQSADIGEAAFYRWYNEAGELIYEGRDTTFVPTENTTYTLEVIAHADGFKDYDKKTVVIKEQYISHLYPNPSSNQSQLTVEYEASTASSAYLQVLNSGQTVIANHILHPKQQQTSINISNLNQGNYILRLICDGVLVDAKVLTVN